MRLTKNIIKDESVCLDFGKDSINPLDILECENMLLTDRGFKTRPGINPIRETPVFLPSVHSEYADFKLTNFFLTIDGKSAQIAVITESDNNSYVYYQIAAIFSDGSHRSLGKIPFTRASADTFASPYSYVVYSGKKTVGCGIYFMARLGYDDVSEDFLIYEISNDMTNWIRLFEKDYYTPTLLCHGRGDRANLAIAQADINLSKPKMLEAPNMLTGNFDCFYTSDGYSSSFTLPEFEGTPEKIICSLTTDNGKVFTWEMNSVNGYSAEADILDITIIAKFKPTLNQVVFIRLDSVPYSPYYYGLQNNMRFSVKNSTNKALRAISVTKSCNVPGNSKLGKASMTVFSGNYYNSDEALFINSDYPLYFPERCTCSLSAQKGEEEAIVVLSDRVIFLRNKTATAFKVTMAEPYSIKNIVSGVEDTAVSYPSLTAEKRINLPEKINDSSVARSGNTIFFCSQKKNLYSLDYSLSLKDFAAEIPIVPSTAAFSGRFYIALNNKHCSVFDIGNPQKAASFMWKFPIKIVASTDFGSETVFLAKNPDDAIFAYRLDGETDRYATKGNKFLTEKISSVLTLRILKGICKKRLYSITVDVETREDSPILIFDGDKIIGRHIISDGKNLLRRPSFFEDISVKFSFKDNALVSVFGVRFSKLSKIRR